MYAHSTLLNELKVSTSDVSAVVEADLSLNMQGELVEHAFFFSFSESPIKETLIDRLYYYIISYTSKWNRA